MWNNGVLVNFFENGRIETLWVDVECFILLFTLSSYEYI
jgi:hypothetical protein